MKLVYVTAQTPWGRGETFIIDEMLAVKEAGADLVIIPRNPSKEIFHQEAQALLANAIWLPLVNFRIIVSFLFSLLVKPHLWKVLISIIRYSRTWRILVKNLAVMPKGVFISSLLKKEGIEHIHAHWGSTTATMAWVVSELTGTPWTFTLHRWDIAENNMLTEKLRTAAFARCISQTGREEVLRIVGDEFAGKTKVVHMGIPVSHTPGSGRKSKTGQESFVIVCPANLVEVKGHRYLVEACAALVAMGFTSFQCVILGDGPLKRDIQNLIRQHRLEDKVVMSGIMAHERLMGMYEDGRVDAVVLPSINTRCGDKEGIPVALMEAMAHGIPVVSTSTGGIPELLSDGAGIMVEEKRSRQLADAIENLIKDVGLAQKIGQKGYERVKAQFDTHKNMEQLLQLMKQPKRLER